MQRSSRSVYWDCRSTTQRSSNDRPTSRSRADLSAAFLADILESIQYEMRLAGIQNALEEASDDDEGPSNIISEEDSLIESSEEEEDRDSDHDLSDSEDYGGATSRLGPDGGWAELASERSFIEGSGNGSLDLLSQTRCNNRRLDIPKLPLELLRRSARSTGSAPTVSTRRDPPITNQTVQALDQQIRATVRTLSKRYCSSQEQARVAGWLNHQLSAKYERALVEIEKLEREVAERPRVTSPGLSLYETLMSMKTPVRDTCWPSDTPARGHLIRSAPTTPVAAVRLRSTCRYRNVLSPYVHSPLLISMDGHRCLQAT
eukprot:Protomagalhaensia_wolfi_Nauph_80__1707@NODE_205_length_3188_cov_53_191172_g154_i0_p1_GENE_NODE_205_length_3188_cov_53_191172_g154_i0NODE_205_length_3188_cov_53_191172_g154_i0_p1_ORF_typecomplete_len317_score46_76DNA_pol_phi/PF04931_13/1_5DNA_pol_phi/PF04931_13/1_8e03_NODE_205_length_3188_cov_53_191172_g154_i039989